MASKYETNRVGWLRGIPFGVLALALGTLGCGGGYSSVTGKVTLNGQPVKGGTLIFSPSDSSGAKAATAEIKPDGTFTVGTGTTDGALPGHYLVTFTPPAQVLTEEQRTNPKYIAPPPMYMGYILKQREVEVKSGATPLDLELVPGKR